MTDTSHSEIEAVLNAASAAHDVGAESPEDGGPTGVPEEVRRILKIEVPVIVQLADRKMSLEEVLELNVGSIIQFEKPFDAELELMITNRRIGFGHAVKVGENFGLRITRIGSIYDTIRALGR